MGLRRTQWGWRLLIATVVSGLVVWAVFLNWVPGLDPRLTLNTGGPMIISLAFGPDGKELATVDINGAVRLWDTQTDAERACLWRGKPRAEAVFCIPRKSRWAAGFENGIVRFWNTTTHMEEGLINGRFSVLRGMATNGQTLILAQDSAIRVWDLIEGKDRGKIQAHKLSVDGLAISPDGMLAASTAFPEGRILVWDLGTFQRVAEIHGREQRFDSFCFSRDSSLLFAACSDGTIHRWEAKTGKGAGFVSLWARPHFLALSPDGNTLACGLDNNRVCLYDLATGKCKVALTRHPWRSLAFAPNGRALATGGHDGMVRLWDVGRETES